MHFISFPYRDITVIDDGCHFIDQSPDLIDWPAPTEADSTAATITSRTAHGDSTETLILAFPSGHLAGFVLVVRPRPNKVRSCRESLSAPKSHYPL